LDSYPLKRFSFLPFLFSFLFFIYGQKKFEMTLLKDLVNRACRLYQKVDSYSCFLLFIFNFVIIKRPPFFFFFEYLGGLQRSGRGLFEG